MGFGEVKKLIRRKVPAARGGMREFAICHERLPSIGEGIMW